MKIVRGFGPLWVGLEKIDPEDPPATVERTWIREIDPPHRLGHGFQVLLVGWAVSAGWCRRAKGVTDDETHSLLWAMGGEAIPQPSAAEIGKWAGACPQCNELMLEEDGIPMCSACGYMVGGVEVVQETPWR